MSGEEREQPRTVFRAPDQEEIIARIESIEDDEARSTFFDDRLAADTGPAHRTFEAGLTAFTGVAPDVARSAAGTTVEPAREASAEPAREASAAATAAGPRADWQADPSSRAAFILRGPAGVDRSLGQP